MTRAERDEWSRAFAQQGLSDLRAREALLAAGAHRCHTLHFLQMAAEKICKAHLYRSAAANMVERVHSYTAGVLPVLARQFSSRMAPWQTRRLRQIAKAIELLAPSCDDAGRRPDNCEYPWLGADGRVHAPCEYRFPGIDENERLMLTVVSILVMAAESYGAHDGGNSDE